MKNKETQRQKKQARLQGAYLSGSSANDFAYFGQQTLYKSSVFETQELPQRKAINTFCVLCETFLLPTFLTPCKGAVCMYVNHPRRLYPECFNVHM